jgi:hypothetical protein
MNRRSFLAWSASAPLSAASVLIRPRGRYRQEGATPPSGVPIPTGMACLDEILGGGLVPGELTLLAQTPGSEIMDYLAVAILDHHLQRRPEPAALVTARWNRDVLISRIAASRSGVDRHRAWRGLWRNRQEREAYLNAARSVETSALHCESIQRLRTLADVEQSFRGVHEAHPLALVVMDDIAELRDIASSESREEGAARVGRHLHEMARSMSVPILAGCSVAWATEWGPLSPELTRGFLPLSQRDLGALVPILDHCDAALFASELPQLVKREWRVSIDVAFHPRASRGSSTCHTIDRGTGRITDGA